MPSENYASIDQFKLDGGSGQTFYMDNLYFWKRGNGEPDPDPDPTDATVTISANPATCRTGETVTFTVTVVPNDYTVKGVEVKVDGETLNVSLANSAPRNGMEKAGSSQMKYMATWTPTTEGVHTVTATVSTSEGKTFSPAALSYTVTKADDPEPGEDDAVEKIFTFTSDQGEQPGPNLYSDGYQKFSWDGTNVTYTVHLNDVSKVPGGELLEGWYWKQNGGFSQTRMTKNSDGDYSIVLTGYKAGDTLQGHSKVVYKGGGMGVTPTVEFTIPTPTGCNEIIEENSADVMIYDLQGCRVREGRLAPGIYIVVKGSKVNKMLIK